MGNANLRAALLAALLLVPLLGLASASPAHAAEARAKVIVVLDASGSMWGQIGGRTKIEIAREVVADIVKDWDPKVELGLSAYGHRRKGDCTDIELLLPVGKAEPARVVDAVNALKPKGKTPLSAAVREAAAALKYTEEAATVILVTDGEETCDADPCALAKELEEGGVDFTAHVVGFDIGKIKKDDRAALQCLAERTGGRFLEAGDAGTLRTALATAVEEVKAAAKPVQATVAVTSGKAVLTVVHEAGAKPLREGRSWRVYPIEAGGKPAESSIGAGYENPHTFVLPAGRYLATVEVGKAKAKGEFEVKAGETVEATLVAGSGKAVLTAVHQAGAKPLREGRSWRVYPIEAGGKPAESYIDAGYDNPQAFVLPAGRYLATVEVGKAKAKAEFEVKAGETVEATLVAGSGKAVLTVVHEAGAKPLREGRSWRVYPIEAGGKPSDSSIDAGYDNPQAFVLPAGRYLAAVEVGKAKAKAEFEVKAGETVEATLATASGKAVLKLVQQSGGSLLGTSRTWRVYPVETGGKPADRSIDVGYENPQRFVLPAGAYVARLEMGAAKAEKRFDLAPGQEVEIEFVAPAR